MAAQLSPEEYFHAYDGSVLKGLDDLKRFLERVDEDVFRRHVDDTKNDFYNWVKDCIRKDIGESIKASKTQDSMLSAIHTAESAKSDVAEKSSGTVSADNLEEGHRSIQSDYDDSGDFFSGSSGLSVPSPHADTSERKNKGGSTKNKPRPGSKTKANKTSRAATKGKSKTQASPKRKRTKTTHKDYKEDFDYSFDLESEREELDRIRERISRLNKEIVSSSPDGSSESSSKGSSNDATSSTNERSGLGEESSAKDSESSRTRSGSTTKRHGPSSKKTGKRLKKSDDDVSSDPGASSRSSKKRSKRSEEEGKDITLSFIQQPKKSRKGSLQKSAKDSRKHNLEVVDEKNLEHEMKNFYGQSINETKDKKRNPLFKRLMGKFSRTEKIVKQELPNLHDMERGKKAEETFNPYIQIDHPWNYHNHGFPDFIKGLLIGMLIGMLFLALFL